MRASNLGEMEIVTATSMLTSSKREAHITALEDRVDGLEATVLTLKSRLSAKPSTVTQEMYDILCRKLQAEVNKNLPF